ncbi:MAG TPA: hypothetical protein VM511_12165 [Luteolibacter sp.]|nr:hypothetical protein [Luteolibacter sp.]
MTLAVSVTAGLVATTSGGSLRISAMDCGCADAGDNSPQANQPIHPNALRLIAQP